MIEQATMSERDVRELETRIGAGLPEDYRSFLVAHTDRLLDREITFASPRNGVVDELLTAADILKNDDCDRIGIPEESLMHIGGNLLGHYLYLDLSRNGFGRVHYMTNYIVTEVFDSFGALLAELSSDHQP